MPGELPSNGPNASMGLMFAGSQMAAATLLGLLLDYFLGTMPGCTIGFTLFGFVAAFIQLMKMSKALAKKKPQPPKDSTGP
jgi:F0F1-type ATP synthase assembly protein I